MKKFLIIFGLFLAFLNAANAQCCAVSGVSVATCCTISITNGTCCTVSAPDDSTMAYWAARKAVTSQLDWFNDKEVSKMDREEIDKLQERVDALCKWAKTLSNHIFSKAYAEWGDQATTKINDRRHTLDTLDVAKSLVTGLPKPPTK